MKGVIYYGTALQRISPVEFVFITVADYTISLIVVAEREKKENN